MTLDDGKEILVLVNEVERDFITRQMHHVTFQTIHKGQKVTTEVPIRQVGDSPAVKAGMIIVTLLDKVEIEAIPSQIPEALEISIEGLVEDGDQLSLADLVIPEGSELKDDPDQPVAKVETPRAQEEEPEVDEEIDPSEVPSDHGSDDGEAGDEGDSAEKSD